MDYEIYNEDCISGMKRIPDGSVDAIIADLPYGTTDCAFDKRIPFEPMWEQFWRVTKLNAAIVLFSQMPFGSDLIQSQRKLFRYEIIWEKSLGVGFLNAKKMPLRCHENILLFYRKLPTYNPQFTKGKPYKARRTSFSLNYQHQIQTTQNNDGKRYPRDVQKFFNSTDTVHPQQKPLELMSWLVRTYTNEGELVLDATMGSGSTGVACMKEGRRFIGYELEKKFYDISKVRIETALAEKSQELF